MITSHSSFFFFGVGKKKNKVWLFGKIISNVLCDLCSSFIELCNLRIADNILPQRDFGVRARRRDGPEAVGLDAARPVADPDVEFLRGAASLRDRVFAVHGGVCEGQGVPELLCQRLCASSRFDGALEGLLREEARGSGFGLA